MNAPVNVKDMQRAHAGGNTSTALIANSFPAMLKKMVGEIGNALPKHMTADRMTRIALTEFRKNKALAECDPRTICASIVIASQLGLEPGVTGQGYLVPYKGKCQFIPGWQGLVDLVSRSGRATVWTGAVYKGDEFDYALGDRPFITHKPGDEDQTIDNLLYVYAVGRVKNSDWPVIEVWSLKKVRRHFQTYNKVGEKHYANDPNNVEMYARKVALLQVLKYMPKSVEVSMATQMDHDANSERGQNINWEDAINGEYVEVSDEEAPEKKEDKKPEPSKASKPKQQDPPDQQGAPTRQGADRPAPPSDTYVSLKDKINECTSTQDLVLIKKEVELLLRNNSDERELLLDHLARKMEALGQQDSPTRPRRTIE